MVSVVSVSCRLTAGFFPTKAMDTDMRKPRNGISDDFESTLTRAFTEGVIFRQVEVTIVAIGYHQRLKIRNGQFAKSLITFMQPECCLDRFISKSPHMQKTRGCIHDLNQPTAFSKQNA